MTSDEDDAAKDDAARDDGAEQLEDDDLDEIDDDLDDEDDEGLYDFLDELATVDAEQPTVVAGRSLEDRQEDTRKWIAIALVATFAATSLSALLAVIAGWAQVNDIKSLLEVLLPPLVALTGSVLGFYFGTRDSC